MIRVRRWCCRDSLELVLSRCCFTWCRRALSNLIKNLKTELPTTATVCNPTQTSASLTGEFCHSDSIEISLVHAAAGLGYIEFLRLFLIWRLLHLRQVRIYNSNNLNSEESKLMLRLSLEKIELISGLQDDSTDKNGFSALMWAGLKDHVHVLRLLAMWSPRTIMIQHSASGLNLIDILQQANKSHMISHVMDIVDRYNDTNGTFLSPPAGQIDALWECMASTSESDFDDLAGIDDILKFSADCPTDDISSSANSRHEADHHSMDSSKCQSMEDLDGVNQNEVQMVCLAGRIIQAMPIRIKQTPSSMDCNEFTGRGNLNEDNLITNSSHRQGSHFRPVLDRNRSFSHSSFSSAGADGIHNNIGSGRLSNGRHTTDDSGISTPFDDSRYLRQSPSPSREFNLDSPPPTTAEIADHFNAPACFMEADFSRLTLSDQEQKRLYEAAKLIQKCYRRYRQGKTHDRSRGTTKTSSNSDESPCKKVFLTASKASTYQSKLQYIVNKVVPANHGDPGKMNANLSNNEDGCQKYPNRIVNKRRFSSHDEQEVDADCQKEIEAAIIIQSYYRRYKQYAYYKRMCQAAVLIQNQFRWYVEHKKSAADHSQNQITSNGINNLSVSQNYRYGISCLLSLDNTSSLYINANS